LDNGDYQIPFKSTSRIDKITIKLEPPTLTPEDMKKLKETEAEALDGTPLRHVQPGLH
jgi:hypothetical protein